MSHAATSNARSRALLKKADRIRARADHGYRAKSILLIALSIVIAGLAGYWLVGMLEPTTTGLPLLLAVAVPTIGCIGSIAFICFRTHLQTGFRIARHMSSTLKAQAKHQAVGRGDGGIFVGLADRHEVTNLQFDASESESAAALISALTTAARAILASTTHSSSSLRARATA